jgi:superfamily II DNA helicase RecQ
MSIQFKFFVIPAINPNDGAEELNLFLRSHRVLTVERQMATEQGCVFWSVCVQYLHGSTTSTTPQKIERKIDYREVLDDIEFPVFARLRELRKEIATREGIPVYTVFTNEQLAQIVKTRATSRAAVAQIEGIGASRIEKYADVFIAIIKEAFSQ